MKKIITVLLVALFTMPLAALAAEVNTASEASMATVEKSPAAATLIQNRRRMRQRVRMRTRTRMRNRMRMERRHERRHHRRHRG